MNKQKTQRIGWKMAWMYDNGKKHVKHVLLKLEILGRVVTSVVDDDGRRLKSGDNIVFSAVDKHGVPYTGIKRRTSKARVLEVYSTRYESYRGGGGSVRRRVSRRLKNYGTIVSYNDSQFRYEVGKIATPKCPLNTDVNEACGSGIHFFDTKREALMY